MNDENPYGNQLRDIDRSPVEFYNWNILSGSVLMKCTRCGSKFGVVTGGHGNSGPPGHYFIAGIVFLVMGIALAFAGILVWAGVCCFGGFVFVGWAFLARSECFNPDCPKCGFENSRSLIKPWSF